MANTRNFMMAAGKVDDPELTTMMRASMLDQPGGERFHWLKQIEAALDGYGGERHFSAADRIVGILRTLEAELRGDASLTAT